MVRTRNTWVLLALMGCIDADVEHFEAVSLADPPPPIRGGTLAIDEGLALVADPDRDRLQVVDLEARQIVRTIALPPGSEPFRVAITPGRYWISLAGIDAVASVDRRSLDDLRLDRACAGPRGLAADGDGVVVACVTGKLVAVGADRTVRELARLAPGLRDVVEDGDAWHVTTLRRVRMGRVRTERVPMHMGPLEIGDMVVGSEVGLSFRRERPTNAVRARTLPDGLRVLHQLARVGPPESPAPGNRYFIGPEGEPGCGNGSFSVAVTDVREEAASTLRLTDITVPIDFATSVGGEVAVVSPGQVGGHRAPLQIYDLNRRVEGTSDCVPVARSEALPGQATSVAFSAAHGWVVQLREPAGLWFEGETLALGGPSRRDSGHDLFYFALEGQGACASCHLEGGDDGHAWRALDGSRNRTLSLRAGVTERLRYHWDGDEDDLRQLLGRQLVGSGLRPDDEQIEALVTWLGTLEPLPSLTPDEPLRDHGEQVARSLGCFGCHGPSGDAVRPMADVGKGLVKVPDLREMPHRAPFMRDGCAETLEDRFDARCGGSQHGSVEDLSPAERRALIAYLEGL